MANISTLGQALDQISRLKTQTSYLDLLTTQITTGKKSQTFAGLGIDALQSKRARADISSLETYINNIKNANRRINLMQNSIEDLKNQTQNISTSLTIAVQEGDYPDLETIKELAKNTYDFILDVMNTQDGDRYLFSGADSSTKPINDTGLFQGFLGDFIPDSSDLTNPPLTASGVVGQWGDGSITTDQFIASYQGVSETIMGYSNSLTTDTAGKVYARVDDTAEFDYTVLADTDGMKDILIALNVLKSIPPVEYAPGALNDPTATTIAGDTPPNPPAEKQENFFQVINDLAAMMNNAVNNLSQEGFKLAQTQAQITLVKQSHEYEINTLKNVVGDVEDIDLTEAAAKIQTLQVQLEASFRVTALVSELSLARFL